MAISLPVVLIPSDEWKIELLGSKRRTFLRSVDIFYKCLWKSLKEGFINSERIRGFWTFQGILLAIPGIQTIDGQLRREKKVSRAADSRRNSIVLRVINLLSRTGEHFLPELNWRSGNFQFPSSKLTCNNLKHVDAEGRSCSKKENIINKLYTLNNEGKLL